jgi:hypothetical protein
MGLIRTAQTAILASLAFISVEARGAKVPLGTTAPAFRLEALDGKRIDLATLSGKSAVLVVARSRAAAKRCKKWVLSVDRRLGRKVSVYQVIVAQKPWYLPNFVVRSKIESLIPRQYHRHVLIEWREHFAKQFGIPKDRTPTVLMIGPKGKLRWQYRGSLSERAWDELEAALPRQSIAGRPSDKVAAVARAQPRPEAAVATAPIQ